MLIYKIEWSEIASVLDITTRTLLGWRDSGDVNKNEAIDHAIQEVVKSKEVKNT